MQPHEVSAVQGHDGTLIGPSQLKNGLVGQPLSGLAGIRDDNDVVPHSTQRAKLMPLMAR